MRIRIGKLALLIILIAALTICCISCNKLETLDTPQDLTLEGSTLSWTAVERATSYEILIDDESYITFTNSYSISVDDDINHIVRVRATADGYAASKYSEPIAYGNIGRSTLLPMLAAPTRISVSGNRLTWNSVSNAKGYRIFYGATLKYTVSASVNYYDLEFENRTYSISVQVQAIGDDITYSSSIKSAVYTINIQNGVAPLAKLPAITLSYDYATRSLSWGNRYGETVSYSIHINGNATAVYTDKADPKESVMYYQPSLIAGSTYSYTLRLLSNDGMYDTSTDSNPISFPLAPSGAPSNLKVDMKRVDNADKLVFCWDTVNYCDGYNIEIDGVEYSAIQDNYCTLPSGLSDGKHTIRVRSVGEGTFYSTSPYTAGMQFDVAGGQLTAIKLERPSSLGCSYNAASSSWVLDFSASPYADRYDIVFTTPDRGANYQFSVSSNQFKLTYSGSVMKINDQVVDGAEKSRAVEVWSLLSSGVLVSAQALSNNSLLHSSLISAELYVYNRYAYTNGGIIAPASINYGAFGLTWNSENSAGYILELDGATINAPQASYDGVLSAGKHIVRILTVSGNSAYSNSGFSAEYEFESPIRLAAPTEVGINANLLRWSTVSNSSGYSIYVNGELLTTVDQGTSSFDLSNHITVDGVYHIYIIADSYTNSRFSDSAPSVELIYKKTDGVLGSAVKPFEIRTAEDFLSLIPNNPTAHFSILALNLNFAKSGNDKVWESLFDDGEAFSGYIEGNGCVISGIRLTSAVSLLGRLSGATIRNLTVNVSDVTVNSTVDTTFGIIASDIMVSTLYNVDVVVSGQISCSGNLVFGGLVGSGTGTVTDCTINVEMSITSDSMTIVGGIAGEFTGSVTGSRTQGSFIVDCEQSSLILGGILGKYSGSINGSNSTLDITADVMNSLVIGGLGGRTSSASASITNSHYNGKITAYANNAAIGGAQGEGAVALSGISVNGEMKISAESSINAGGAISEMLGNAENITVTLDFDIYAIVPAGGTNSCLITVGGIAASAIAGISINGCSFSGDIVISGGDVIAGGLVGESNSSISGSVSGAITVNSPVYVKAGGLCGVGSTINGTVSVVITVTNAESYAKVGGLVAESSGDSLTATITSAVLLVTGSSNVTAGGVAAEFGGTLSGAIVTIIDVSGSSCEVGGLVAKGTAIILQDVTCSADISVNGREIICGGIAGEVSSISSNDDMSLVIDITATATTSALVGGFAAKITTAAEMQKLTLTGAILVTGNCTVGSVAAEGTIISDCVSDVNIAVDGSEVILGGIAGTVSDINRCTFTGDIAITNLVGGTVGGVVAFIDGGTVSRAEVNGSVISVTGTGNNDSILRVGVIGGNISAAMNNITVANSTVNVAGIAEVISGGMAGELEGSVSTAVIDWSYSSEGADVEYLGGMSGIASAQVSSLNIGNGTALALFSTATSSYVGGISGKSYGLTISSSTVSVNISGAVDSACSMYAGGISGYAMQNQVVLTNSTIIMGSTLSGIGSCTIGGAVGSLTGVILSGATVSITISSEVEAADIGGVVGECIGGTVTKSYANGTIVSSGTGTAGGIAGKIENGYVNVSYSMVTLNIAQADAGGIAGAFNGSIINDVYTVVNATGTNCGGFAGKLTGGSVRSVYVAGVISSANSFAVTVSDTNVAYAVVEVSITAPYVGSGSDEGIESLSLSYGTSSINGFGPTWQLAANHLPYLEGVGGQGANAPLGPVTNLAEVSINADCNIYTVLTGYYGYNYPNVVWVSTNEEIAQIANGAIIRMDNGAVTLDGYVNGGFKVYSVVCNVSGIVNVLGAGTQEDPYVINELRWIKYIATYNASADGQYFELDYDALTDEDGSIDMSDFIWPLVFSEEAPFTGHFDGNGAIFSGLTIPYGGLFNYIDGGVIKGFTLSNCMASGEAISVYADNSTIRDITLIGYHFVIANSAETGILLGTVNTCIIDNIFLNEVNVSVNAECSLAMILESSESTITNVSVTAGLSFNTADGSRVSLIVLSAYDTTISNCEIAVTIDGSYLAGARLSGIADALDTLCQLIDSFALLTINVRILDGTEAAPCNIAGLVWENNGSITRCYSALDAEGSTSSSDYVNTAAFIGDNKGLVEDVWCILSVMSDITAIYSGSGSSINVSYGESGDVSSWSGYGWIDGALPHLEGSKIIFVAYAVKLFEAATEQEISNIEMDGVNSVVLSEIAKVESEEMLARMGSIEIVEGETIVTIDGNTITALSDGVATLKYVTPIGSEFTFTVTVTNNIHFALGSGTESDPFIVVSADDLVKMGSYPGAYFKLLDNITATLDTELTLSGYLNGDNKTLSITLGAEVNSLFSELRGEIADLSLILTLPESVTLTGVSAGFIANEADNITLNNVDIIISQCEITLGEDTVNFGYLFGEVSGDENKFVGVQLDISGEIEAEADIIYIGGLVGAASDVWFNQIEVTIQVTADGATVYMGAVVGIQDSFVYIDSIIEGSGASGPTIIYKTYALENITAGGSITINAETAYCQGVFGECSASVDGISIDDLVVSGVDE